MQRYPAIQIPLHGGVFRLAEAARNINAHALRAKPQRGLGLPFHCTAERDAAFQLLSNALCRKSCIQLRLSHLYDIQINFRRRQLCKLRAKLLDVCTLLSDQDAGTRCMDGDAAFLMRPLDNDLRNARLTALLHNELADAEVLMQQLAVLAFVGVPAAVPSPVDPEPKPDRVDFLPH